MYWKTLGLGALTAAVLASTPSWACNRTYTVERGDTLSEIAMEQLGTIFKMPLIQEANRGQMSRNPNRIYVGQVLQMPCEGNLVGEVDWSVMPNPEMVADLMKQADIQVLDIRSKKAHGKSGVIPGAISIPYALWRGPKENRGEPPSAEKVAKLIGDAGLRLDKPIVVVGTQGNPMSTGAASLIYWNLKSSGAKQLAVMRGGYKRWKEAGLPTAKNPSQPKPYVASVDTDWTWRADELTVYGIAQGQVDGHLLDARPHGMFAKLDKLGKALATTLPGAYSLPAPPLMAKVEREDDVLDGVETVIEAFSKLEADGRNGDVVTFCHVGELAALNWFYASELAGMPHVKLYPESLNGWTQAGGRLFTGG